MKRLRHWSKRFEGFGHEDGRRLNSKSAKKKGRWIISGPFPFRGC
jgi:hypothetical protein